MKCTICEKPLTGGLDTFGAVGEEVCESCNADLQYEPESPMGHDERGPYDVMYGHFGGGDPRDFTPDYELCTADEIERWKADVALAESGETVTAPPAGQWFYDKDGNPTMHVLAPKYGIGTYKIRFEDGE